MSGNEAQWLVTAFLNLAGRVALIAMLAGGADLLLRRHSTALKAMVWTIALASIVAVIAMGMFNSPTIHPPIRFKEMSAGTFAGALSRADWPGSGNRFPEMPVEGGMDYEPAEQPSSEPPPSTVDTSPTVPPRDVSGETDVAAEDDDTSRLLAGPGAGSAATSAVRADSTSWQIAGWLVVALAFLAVLFLARVVIGTLGLKKLILKWRAHTPPPSLVETLAEVKKALRIRRTIRLLISSRKDAPITFGVFRPTIVLPAGLTEEISPEGIRQMLAHELGHIRRHDSLVILLQRVCVALCFWHPLVYVACRRLRVLIEDACDDYVLQITGAPDEYAASLTQLAEQNCCRVAGVAAWLGRRRRRLRLEKRIQRILDSRRPIGRVTTTAFLATVAVAVGVSLAASRMPLFGIAVNETTPGSGGSSRERENLKPAKGETPQQYVRRMLYRGHAKLAIEALKEAMAAAADAATSRKLRYELASIYQLLVKEEELDRTAQELWAGLPDDIEEIGEFADFCIASGREKLAREAVARLQEMNPAKKVYYASKLYGAFPKQEELWFPFQPKPLEKTHVKVGTRDALTYRERLIPTLARLDLVTDLDGDGSAEVILSTPPRSREPWIRVFSQEGELLWKDDKKEGQWDEDIGAFDLDGDGKLEVIAAGRGITVYDYRGKILWRRPSAEDKRLWLFRAVRVLQSPEGRCRILAAGFDHLVCFLPDGGLEWEKSDVSGRYLLASDVTGDGWDEILLRKPGRKELVVLDQKGREIGTIPGGSEGWNTLLAVADLNADGKPEIVGVGGKGRARPLRVYDLDGKQLWETETRHPALSAIGDMDGDAKKEIACRTPRGELRLLNHDGSTRFEVAVWADALQFADVDGDGNDEIFIATIARQGGYLLCIERDGLLRWRFPLPQTWRHGDGFYAMPAPARGKKGIVAVARGALTILSAEGKVLSMTAIGSMGYHPEALAADVDGDGSKEVISLSSLVTAYDLPGNSALWGALVSVDDYSGPDAAAAIDVDADGAEELVLVCRGYVCVVNGKGELVHTKYVGKLRRPALGKIDVEGDGKDEVLFSDDRRLLILTGGADVIAAASHRRSAPPGESTTGQPPQGVLGANLNSVPGEEVLICGDSSGVTAYSAEGHVMARFRRPSWLPVHAEYGWWQRPQIFPPMDVNGDGRRELVARLDRLFVWDIEGKLLRTGLNDYPNQGQIGLARLKNRLSAAVRYAIEGGAFGTLSDYLKKAEKKPLMELCSAALPINVGKKTHFVICAEKGLRLTRGDGRSLWQISGEYGSVRRIGFGDFDGDGKREIVIRAESRHVYGGTDQTTIRAYSLRGRPVWEAQVQALVYHPLVCEDFDGDGFIEIAFGDQTGIAVLDLTPQ